MMMAQWSGRKTRASSGDGSHVMGGRARVVRVGECEGGRVVRVGEW